MVLHPLPLLLTYGKAVRMALQHKHACTCTCTYVHARVLIYAPFSCTHSHVHAHVTRTQAGNGTAAPAEEEAPAEGSIGFGPGLIPPHASFTEPCCMCPLYDEETGEISGWVADVPKDPRGAASTYIVVAQAIAEREDKVCCRIFPSCLMLACARSRDAVSQEHSWVGIWTRMSAHKLTCNAIVICCPTRTNTHSLSCSWTMKRATWCWIPAGSTRVSTGQWRRLCPRAKSREM